MKSARASLCYGLCAGRTGIPGLCLLVLLFTYCVSAAHANASHANGNALDALFEQNPDEPGCAVGYARDGKIEYLRGFGRANLEHDVPISAQTRFHVASVSKEFTAAAVAMLMLQGKISFDDDVRKFLPDFPKFGEVITIEHLLQHSSGLVNHSVLLGSKGFDYGNSMSQEDALNLVFAEGLNFKPGTKYEYSSSYLVLSQIVEKVSGLPLREFLRLQIFEPLGMNNSGLHDDFSIIPNRAEGYLKSGDEWINDRVRYAFTGSGGVHMTIKDLLIWDYALRNDRLMKGLAKPIFESTPIPVMDNLDYHFGFFRSIFRDAPSAAHSGSYQGTKTLMYSFEPGLATAIACNHRTDVEALTWALMGKILAGDALPKTPN